MTYEEKQLLIKDLCARLPYGVKGLHRGQVHELFTIDGREVNNVCIQVNGYDAWFSVDTFKPFLRPMSSMTKEETEKWVSFINHTLDKEKGEMLVSVLVDDVSEYTDWLDKNMFDYRGLIPMGLAFEAPKDMYKIE